jgi:hypothetical protein
MQKILFSFGIVLLLLSVGCKEKEAKKEWSDLPVATSLDSLKETDFVPTLENPFKPERNTVYAAALLYAWDTITKLLPGAIDEEHNYTIDFNLLRRSNSFKNSLAHDEYSVKTEVGEGYILAEAFFNKTLPFPAKMEKADEPMLFSGQKVNAFGMYGANKDITAYSQLLFYDNDDRFLLKFSPKDEKHELWLMKAADTDSTLTQVVKRAKEWKAIGETEAGNTKLAWKYSFNEDDLFSIPEIKFNIYTNYKKIEGQFFYVQGKEKVIKTAYQRTGFILNETGAVAESHAVMAVVDSAGPMRVEQPQPKKMVFDKSFYIILKRKDSENPYFVMRVANAELLVKQ